MELNREQVLGDLHAGVCVVKFTKANGEARQMQCTLKEDIVPPATKDDPISQKKVRAVNEEVVVCWDIEKEGWRSFRLDSVNEYSAVGN